MVGPIKCQMFGDTVAVCTDIFLYTETHEAFTDWWMFYNKLLPGMEMANNDNDPSRV